MMKRRTFVKSVLATVAAASLPEAVFSSVPAPFKLYDTHAHFYSNDVAKYPIDGERRATGPSA